MEHQNSKRNRENLTFIFIKKRKNKKQKQILREGNTGNTVCNSVIQ